MAAMGHPSAAQPVIAPEDAMTVFSDVLFSPPLPQHAPDDNDDDEGDIYRGEPPLQARSPSLRSVSSASSSSGTSTTSSSSSSSSEFGARLGAIAGVLERAITRWARANASSSSLSSTSSSTSSTVSTLRTLTRPSSIAPRPRRRRRQSSVASLHNAQSERQIHARMRAREESRQIPRELTLYLPPSLRNGGATQQPSTCRGAVETIPEGEVENEEEQVLQSVSLPFVLARLDTAMKKSSKARRMADRQRPSKSTSRHRSALSSLSAVAAPPILRRTHRASTSEAEESVGTRKSRKGKERERTTSDSCTTEYAQQMRDHHASLMPYPAATPHMERLSLPRPTGEAAPEAAWWLDVASPTYDDLRNIGKLLHLHPLTLEDILQQEPREKLELFPMLGYYFIVFRAIESRTARGRLRRLLNPRKELDKKDNLDDEGIIGEVLVYLVVFRDGVCSFHFADIKEHTDRVRSRAMMFEETRITSADWLAHGMLDSIVDSFFPFLEEIEKEVMIIEDMAFSDDPINPSLPLPLPPTPKPDFKDAEDSSRDSTLADVEQGPLREKVLQQDEKARDEKLHVVFGEPSLRRRSDSGRLPIAFLPVRLALRRFRRRTRKFFRRIMYKIFPWFDPRRSARPDISAREGTGAAAALRRMARTRRLVTNLTRLLATKADVVARVQKRLMSQAHGDPISLAGGGASGQDLAGAFGIPSGPMSAGLSAGGAMGISKSRDAAKVAIYYGDVQDHILTMHDSLAHYEHMLSQSHPTYLTRLRHSGDRSNGRMDKALFLLTCVIVCVYLIQPTLGLFSMNANVPHNTLGGTKHWYWGLVILICVVEICLYARMVRWLWRRTKRTSFLL